MAAERTFTGEELFEALEADAFARPDVVVAGMVKPSEAAGCISFAPGGCESWIDVPTSMIERAEHLRTTACRDHTHPVFVLTLAEPASDESRVLAALLAARHQAPHEPGADAGRPPWGPAAGSTAIGRVDVVTGGAGAMLCARVCDAIAADCMNKGIDIGTCHDLFHGCRAFCNFVGTIEGAFGDPFG